MLTRVNPGQAGFALGLRIYFDYRVTRIYKLEFWFCPELMSVC